MKKAVIIVSFGCSIQEGREKYIDNLEREIQKQIDMYSCRAFTSEIIRKKLSKELFIHNVSTCLQELKENEFTHVYILPTHILPGVEYDKIISACSEYKDSFEEIKISRPFLDENMGKEEIEVIKSYVSTNLSEGEAIVLVGHGTYHSAHKYYSEFENLLKKELPLYIVSIEGGPSINTIAEELSKDKIKKVNLYPFLIVAGDHALNDIGSDDGDSIKSKLINKGFDTIFYEDGLGAHKETADLYSNRLKEII